jgi:hypothetical protein
MTRRRPGQPEPTVGAPARAAIAGLAFGLVGFVLGAAALAVVLLRPGAPADACRQAAWSALPAVAALPSGWTMSGSGIYVDSVGTTLSGPTPSASDEPTPAIFVSVGCYGSDAHDGLLRSHVVALGEGSTDVSFPRLGDESFATHDEASGQYTVLVRRGPLVATLAAAGSIDVDDLIAATRAVDAAMTSGPTSAGAATPGPAASGAPSPSPAGSAEATPEASVPDTAAQHLAPDLEKLLPASVAGVDLQRSSFAGSDVLGNDQSSKGLTDALTAMGKAPKDLEIAEALDTSGSSDWYIDAFRLPGVSGSKLVAAILTGWLDAGAQGTKSTTATIDGKRVTHLDRGADTPGDWLYVKDDVVFDVAASDEATARQVLAALP